MCVRVNCVFGEPCGDVMLNASEYKQRQEVTNGSDFCMLRSLSRPLRFLGRAQGSVSRTPGSMSRMDCISENGFW